MWLDHISSHNLLQERIGSSYGLEWDGAVTGKNQGGGVCVHVNQRLCCSRTLPMPKCLFVGCWTSQQHASVSQGRICSGNFACRRTETEVADQTFYLTQSQYTDTGPTSPSTDPITPGGWQGSHLSANFEVTGMTRQVLKQNSISSFIIFHKTVHHVLTYPTLIIIAELSLRTTWHTTSCSWWAPDVLAVICTQLHPGHLSVRVGDSSRRDEEAVKISNCTFYCDYYLYQRY